MSGSLRGTVLSGSLGSTVACWLLRSTVLSGGLGSTVLSRGLRSTVTCWLLRSTILGGSLRSTVLSGSLSMTVCSGSLRGTVLSGLLRGTVLSGSLGSTVLSGSLSMTVCSRSLRGTVLGWLLRSAIAVSGLGSSIAVGGLGLTVSNWLLGLSEVTLATESLGSTEEANWAGLGLLLEATADVVQVHGVQETVLVNVRSGASLSPLNILLGWGTVVVGLNMVFVTIGKLSLLLLGENVIDQKGSSIVGLVLGGSNGGNLVVMVGSGGDVLNSGND